jgi:hypothetical protein
VVTRREWKVFRVPGALTGQPLAMLPLA